MSIKLYVEGGGNSKALRTACRKGFRLFIENAGISCRQIGVGIVACGSRQNAYDSFATAYSTGDSSPMLLVDAEDALTTASPWDHLRNRDGWSRPNGSTDGQCHLMVQIMESWFLAHRATLASFYGQNFQGTALPGNLQVEQIRKTDVLDGLAHATRNTQKGRYDKGPHSFDILARLDPGTVEAAAPFAKRFLDTLRAG